jgi:uncharacterized membrane protein
MTKYKLITFAEKLLFVSSILIVFFLCFESLIVLPSWLHVIGRMHPMFLHFPIVILLLAFLFEFFRFKPGYINQLFFQEISRIFLLIGALSATITVIMGLFLSMEGEYSGNVLLWHKWLGSIIALLAAAIYGYRNISWYKAGLAKPTAILLVIGLFITGHLGAELTHGENFILAPVYSPEKPQVPIDEALVYQDVIAPIFASKCLSCHNNDKSKGSLLMDSPENLLKGGKSGKLFLAGNPEKSLMMERIHLPMDDKKHMPLASKPQLTDTEIELLTLWIKIGADFEKKVIDLPPGDSLRMLASTLLKPVEEHYDFKAADSKIIAELNNNYRVVEEIARESPALNVTVYNRNVYNSKSVEELLKVKKQIVSINLNKMPVKDEELKTIAQFENLRKLSLNFTDIKGDGLKYLNSLKFLKSISLSGVPVDKTAMEALVKIKGLEKVFVWQTRLSENDVKQLRKAYPKVQFLTGFTDEGSQAIKLNPPVLDGSPSAVFTDSIKIALNHVIPGVEIRYTTDGSEPDSINAMLYKESIKINEKTMLRAKAYKKGWYGSDQIQFEFLKSSIKPDSITYKNLPEEKYKASGPQTLIDHELGTMNHDIGKWLGFLKDMEVTMKFNNSVQIGNVSLNVIKNMGAHIFMPTEIEVWGSDKNQPLKLLSTMKIPVATQDQPAQQLTLECKFEDVKSISELKVIAKNVKKIPAWHGAKGNIGWFFIDEILLN